MGEHRAWRLRTRPEGSIKDTDLELCTEPKPSAGDGQLLVKNVFIRFGPPNSLPPGSVRGQMCSHSPPPCLYSIDPTHRIWMSDKAQYMDCVELGDVMRAVTVGVVEESKDANFPVGCHVVGFGGCCDYYVGIPGVNVLYKVCVYESVYVHVYMYVYVHVYMYVHVHVHVYVYVYVHVHVHVYVYVHV